MLQDVLSADLISNGLNTRKIGKKIIYRHYLSSTMDLAREVAQQGTPEGAVVIAGEQHGGKGRLGREWISPAGNIAMSVILYPDMVSVPFLIMLAAVAVARCIEKMTGLQPQIKWPNDILVNGRKICGILIENRIKGNILQYAIIGIGINVALLPADKPEICDIATSLNRETGQVLSLAEIIKCLLAEIERLYCLLPDGNQIYQAWREKMVTLGEKVVVTFGESRISGLAEDVMPDGSLVLKLPDGSTSKVVAGDVTLREKG
jgi:BirA family biotin operon repressor/biotin-[acetyl-CoA-carboxylase] ligase